MSELVSVAVITYNSSRFVLETLESIKNQSYPALELIVSDDCSTDNTVELCRKWLSENGSRFVRTELLAATKNRGISGNANAAFGRCKGKWIKGISGDDILMRDCIKDLVDFCEKGGHKIACAKVVPFGKEGDNNDDAAFWEPKYELLRTLKTAEEQHAELLKDNFIPATTTIWDREFFRSTGGYDEDIPLIEDLPMWLRITEAGTAIPFLEKETVRYRLSSSSVRFNSRYTYSLVLFRNKYLFRNKPVTKFLLRHLDWQRKEKVTKLIYKLSCSLQRASSEKTTKSYRGVFKATSLFGGVQIYQILIQIIRSKFVATLLGPVGMGIQGLLTSTTDMVKQISSLGLGQSAVRDVSEANNSGDHAKVSRTVTVLRRLVWCTGLLGLVLVAAFSPILSKLTFGNGDYTIPFICLSVTLLLDQLCAGQNIVLQGMRRLKELAKATAIGSTIGLAVSVPLYYLLGVKGIVPTLILNSATTLILAWFFARKIKIDPSRPSVKEVIKEGSTMMKMGIAMTASAVLVSVCSYVIRWFIRKEGGIDDVGLYQAAFAIVTTYVGMIFTAISTDYYPRLAGVNKDNAACRKTVNEQGEIAALIMGPLLNVCLVFMPLIIVILYSRKFLPANDYIVWAVFGMFFKMASWIIAFMFIAKGESKLFIINEFIANLYGLALNILGYKLLGLTGLGLSFMAGYIIYLIQVYVIANRKYGFSFDGSFFMAFAPQLLLTTACLLLVLLSAGWVKYVFGSLLIAVSAIIAYKELDRRLDVMEFVKSKLGAKK